MQGRNRGRAKMCSPMDYQKYKMKEPKCNGLFPGSRCRFRYLTLMWSHLTFIWPHLPDLTLIRPHLTLIWPHLISFDPHLTSFDLIWPIYTSFDFFWPHLISFDLNLTSIFSCPKGLKLKDPSVRVSYCTCGRKCKWSNTNSCV